MAMQETRVVERESCEENRILLLGRMISGAQPGVPNHVVVSIPSIERQVGKTPSWFAPTI